jgi:hypothetical protein
MASTLRPFAPLCLTFALRFIRFSLRIQAGFVYTNSFVVNKPEVLIAFAKEKFDNRGRLTDEASRGFLRNLILSLVDLTQRPRAPQPAMTT